MLISLNNGESMGSGFAKRKKEARLLQEKFGKMQENLKHERAEGSAGNGLVTIVLNGEHEMLSLSIKPEAVDPDDVECLEDLIKAAYTDALKKLSQASKKDLSMMGGLPGLGALGL